MEKNCIIYVENLHLSNFFALDLDLNFDLKIFVLQLDLDLV